MTDIIAVETLAKRFDDVQAVSDVSFTVKHGELFGFLGPNGAGKTTTINMLTGLARPDSGTMSIGGLDCTKRPRSAQHLIGVVPDESNLYPELTGFDNLCFCAALYGLGKDERQTRARKLLEDFGLSQAAGRRFGGYSKGMKRKLTIAAGIVHQPQILFLDEPTTGIDVASARQLRQLAADLNESGTTIFLTTHYIEEAERLCDRIAFIVNGRIVQIDSVDNLLQPLQTKHVIQISWMAFIPAVVLIAVTSTFLALFIAVAVSEVFEAQTFSNFFRFPMIFFCGLFFPVEQLPVFLKPVSFVLPLTYGADVLHGAVHGAHMLPFSLDLVILAAFCAGLFLLSLRNIRRHWIA